MRITQNIESAIVQITTKFEPKAEHLVFAEAYIKHGGSITDACIEIDNPTRSLYYQKYKREEGFEEWLSEYAKDEVLKRRGRWYIWAEKFASRGSFQHLNLLMQIAREFAPSAAVDQSTNITVNIQQYDRKDIQASRFPMGSVQRPE